MEYGVGGLLSQRHQLVREAVGAGEVDTAVTLLTGACRLERPGHRGEAGATVHHGVKVKGHAGCGSGDRYACHLRGRDVHIVERLARVEG